MRAKSMDTHIQNGKRGFTLVEILVVVTILAILMALTLPGYLKGRPLRLLSAQANKVGQVVRYGRLQAIRDNQQYYMEFLPEIDMYRLWGPAGWRAYADPLRLDGDWETDGFTYLDPQASPEDVKLDPRISENKPIYTVSPMWYEPFPGATPFNLDRDFDNKSFEGDQAVFPHEVDLRLEPLSWDPPNSDLSTRPDWTPDVNILSRQPLLFLVFYPDGSVSSSWQINQSSTGLLDEIRDLPGGELGVTEIFLQVRGDQNVMAHDLSPDTTGGNSDLTSEPNVSHWDTLKYELAIEETYGRRILINHASGRIKVENFAPIGLDWDQNDPPNELRYF